MIKKIRFFKMDAVNPSLFFLGNVLFFTIFIWVVLFLSFVYIIDCNKMLNLNLN